VLVKAGDNMLVANPKMDITRDVIKGLNKRYKKAHKTAEE
jgi:Skp family chaperone for outer membrane proteins